MLLGLTPRRRAAFVALAAGGLAGMILVFVSPWGGAEDADDASPQGLVKNPAYFPDRAAAPPLRIDEVDLEPALDAGDHSGADEPAVPCVGCLPEAGAIDVAETFLYHMRQNTGVRAELYA